MEGDACSFLKAGEKYHPIKETKEVKSECTRLPTHPKQPFFSGGKRKSNHGGKAGSVIFKKPEITENCGVCS